MDKDIKEFLTENYYIDSMSYIKDCDWTQMYDGNHKLACICGIQRYNDRLAEAKAFVVRKDLRRKGVAKKFIKQCLEKVKHEGIGKVICHVRSENHKSLFLLIKSGFLVEGLMRNNDELGSHIYTLGLEL